MSVAVSISGLGAGRIISIDGPRVALRAEKAAPPGASLSCEVEDTTVRFKVKVSSCKRVEETAASAFRIEGRFVDLTREQRMALETMSQGSS